MCGCYPDIHQLTSHAGRGRSDLIQIYVGYRQSIEPLWTITFLKPKRARLLLSFHHLRPQKISFLESWCHVIGQHSHQNDETTATCLRHALDESKSLDESDSGLVKLILGMKRVDQLKQLQKKAFLRIYYCFQCNSSSWKSFHHSLGTNFMFHLKCLNQSNK